LTIKSKYNSFFSTFINFEIEIIKKKKKEKKKKKKKNQKKKKKERKRKKKKNLMEITSLSIFFFFEVQNSLKDLKSNDNQPIHHFFWQESSITILISFH